MYIEAFGSDEVMFVAYLELCLPVGVYYKGRFPDLGVMAHTFIAL